MTLGSGILWSTVIVLLAVTIYQVSVRNKWGTAGKAFGVLILLGAIIGGAAWGWYVYQDRPQVVTELGGIRLGMTQLDVKLLKGAPTSESEISEQEEEGARFRLGWSYGESSQSTGGVLIVLFYGDTRTRRKEQG